MTGTSIIAVLNKYLPATQASDLDTTVTIDEALAEIYHVAYSLPQSGTSLTASLMFCDYVPDYLAKLSPDEWSILENDFGSIELLYDRRQKKFKRRK